MRLYCVATVVLSKVLLLSKPSTPKLYIALTEVVSSKLLLNVPSIGNSKDEAKESSSSVDVDSKPYTIIAVVVVTEVASKVLVVRSESIMSCVAPPPRSTQASPFVWKLIPVAS